eukprot:TRINITY_DN13352_c0_g1_i2.p3 TRINITY_DN13352_c0_g1~~TRINITY_DN13352_c0_g1_i2.p3  ORF type:complete len:130 (-),score=30.31 TRINITY_DN13352_c0_g1_i2:59-448(-)
MNEEGKKKLFETQDIKFLTRLKYCARDSGTYGDNAPWGEHEMDYVLFAKTNNQIQFKMNPEEVDDVKFVDFFELKQMMQTEGLKWSPWFRIIVDNFLQEWWSDLESVFSTDKYVDGKIHVLNEGEIGGR